MMSTQQDYTVKEGLSTEIIGVKIMSNELSYVVCNIFGWNFCP